MMIHYLKSRVGVVDVTKAEGLIKLFKPRDFETLPIFVKTFKLLYNILLPLYLRGDEIQNQYSNTEKSYGSISKI